MTSKTPTEFFEAHQNEFSMQDMLELEDLRMELNGGPILYEPREDSEVDDEPVIWPASLKFHHKDGIEVIHSFKDITDRKIKFEGTKRTLMNITEEEFHALKDTDTVGYEWNGFFLLPIAKSAITHLCTPDGTEIDV